MSPLTTIWVSFQSGEHLQNSGVIRTTSEQHLARTRCPDWTANNSATKVQCDSQRGQSKNMSEGLENEPALWNCTSGGTVRTDDSGTVSDTQQFSQTQPMPIRLKASPNNLRQTHPAVKLPPPHDDSCGGTASRKCLPHKNETDVTSNCNAAPRTPQGSSSHHHDFRCARTASFFGSKHHRAIS